MPATPTVRVFISYSWDSAEHKQRVLDLAQRLRHDGIDAWIDRFTPFPEGGWPRWMDTQIEQAQFVVVVPTENYAQRFAGKAEPPTGLGATWEGAIITQELYEAGARNSKFLPCLFSAADERHIPGPLRPFTRFRVDTEPGYEHLYRLLTGQPETVPIGLGTVVSLGIGNGAPSLKSLQLPPIHDHATARSNLPRLPYGFFGREDELKRVLDSLSPDARTWGVLIDGPGGIGKTAIAIRAAELTPAGQFRRIVFLSAKSRELTPDGERVLENFVVPGYLDMLNELARQIGQPDVTKSDEKHRPAALQRALQDEYALIIFDNLESLPTGDRDRLFDFLSRLPRGCKAIVTSRRRTDIDARVIRLERLGQPAALEFIARLAEDRAILRKADEAQRIDLYTATGGNPLLIRWVVGQLGRGRCRTLPAALDLLASATADNAPLEYIFGDLVDTFTAQETQALAALSYFTMPVEVKFVAELATLSVTAAQTALEDLGERALVAAADPESRTFALTPQVGPFLRRARSQLVAESGQRLTDRAYALLVENGYTAYDRFHVLEAHVKFVLAALPLFLQGSNDQLQTTCNAVRTFLDFTGRWDDAFSLHLQAERRAIAAGDFLNAGSRAHNAGWISYLRKDAGEVMDSAARAAAHWERARAGAYERASAIRLRGLGYQLQKNHAEALAAFREALALWRTISPISETVALTLNDIADTSSHMGNFAGAGREYQEALRIAKEIGYQDGIAYITGNMALLALDEKNWTAAEVQARDALALAENLGRKELIGTYCVCLAKALCPQDRKSEALSYAQRGVEIFAALNSPDLDWAQAALRECEE